MDRTYCGACGAELDESRALPLEERPPCPACGSGERLFWIEWSDSASASDTLTAAVIRPVGIEPAQAFGTPVVAHAEPALVTATAFDATVETRTGLSRRVVEEAGVVVRVVRHYPPMPDGRRLTTVEDEHGNVLDLGAGATTEDSLVDMIISGALREDEGE
jgi:hypothetical protein